ncbi:MAG: EAL domain-containing protein, partial [Pseudomonadota bacterium]|nr:EAL domain-containing protein [Pseudomonadota bacterium]
TEGVAVELSGETARRLRCLREAGVEVAVDDFGLGYFSFRSLKQLEINRLKIDKSLIQDLDSDHGTLEACRGVVLMAHGMGWTVVAEGVETERQRSLAEEIGCDYLQGYLVCRPGHPAAVEALLAST